MPLSDFRAKTPEFLRMRTDPRVVARGEESAEEAFRKRKAFFETARDRLSALRDAGDLEGTLETADETLSATDDDFHIHPRGDELFAALDAALAPVVETTVAWDVVRPAYAPPSPWPYTSNLTCVRETAAPSVPCTRNHSVTSYHGLSAKIISISS